MNDYNKNKTAKGICITSFCLLVVTLLAQMYVANTTALKSKDFQHLYDKKKTLEKEIALLKFEDSNLSSLSYLESKAYELGFQDMTGTIQPITAPTLASLSTP